MRLMQYRGVTYSAVTKLEPQARQLFYSRTTYEHRIEDSRKNVQLVYRGTPYNCFELEAIRLLARHDARMIR